MSSPSLLYRDELKIALVFKAKNGEWRSVLSSKPSESTQVSSFATSQCIILTRKATQIKLSTGEYQDVINCASNTYYGGVDLSPQEAAVAIRALSSDLALASHDETEAFVREICVNFMETFHIPVVKLTSTGYTSNLLALSSIIKNGITTVIIDAKGHNSMFCSVYASEPLKCTRFQHNNLINLRKLLDNSRDAAHVLVCVESLYSYVTFPRIWPNLHLKVYSMDGSVSDLYGLAQLKQEYGFELFMDESHSIMAIGSSGRGLYQYWTDQGFQFDDPVDMRTLSFGKGLVGFQFAYGEVAADVFSCYRNRLEARFALESSIETL